MHANGKASLMVIEISFLLSLQNYIYSDFFDTVITCEAQGLLNGE